MAGSSIDWKCPTCNKVIPAGWMHNCYEIGSSAIQDGGVGPTTSQVTPCTISELAAENASVAVLTGTRLDVPLVASLTP